VSSRGSAFLRIGGSILILGMLFLFLPFGDLLAALRRVPAVLWPLAIGSYLIAHFLGVMKWRMLTNASGAGLSFATALRAYYWGLFGTTFLPSVVGGDVVKVAAAMRGAKSRTGLVLGSVIDRILDVIGFVAIAGVGAVLSPRSLDPESRRVFISGGLLLVLLAILGAGSFLVLRLRVFSFRIRRTLVKIRQALRAASTRPLALALAFLLGIALQLLLIVINYQLGIAMGIGIPLYVWLFVWPLAKIAGLLPVTQGGIGVREAALAILLAPFGVAGAAAVAAGLAFQGVVIGGGLLAGLIVLTLGRYMRTPKLAPELRGVT